MVKKDRIKDEKPGGGLKTNPPKKMKMKLLKKTSEHMKTRKDMEDEMSMHAVVIDAVFFWHGVGCFLLWMHR